MTRRSRTDPPQTFALGGGEPIDTMVTTDYRNFGIAHCEPDRARRRVLLELTRVDVDHWKPALSIHRLSLPTREARALADALIRTADEADRPIPHESPRRDTTSGDNSAGSTA
jgi:hypothetical protein